MKSLFIKPNIDILKRLPQLELWMHLHPSCFSYLILNRENNQLVDFEQVKFDFSADEIVLEEVKKWFDSHQQILHLPFKTSKIALYSDVFTILPAKSEHPEDVFEFLGYDNSGNSSYLKDKIHDNFYVYYRLKDDLIHFLDNHLVNAEFYCGDSGLLRFYNEKMPSKNYLAVHIYGEDLTLCYKKDKSNFYYNKFKIKAKEDLLYYLRLAYQELELNPNEFPTYLYGFIEEKSPMYSTTYDYLRNFEIDRTLKNTLPFLNAVANLPLHYYVNLWGLYYE